MGYMRHHAIIVTSFQDDILLKAHNQAERMFGKISEILVSDVNGYSTFFIPPDGSKEGWPESDAGDKSRSAFMDWCDAQAYEDGSNSIVAVELRYGDEEKKDMIERKTGNS
jgi:hypothetical protein